MTSSNQVSRVLLILSLIVYYSTCRDNSILEDDLDLANTSEEEHSVYEEIIEPEESIMYNIDNFEQSLKIFSKAFVFITKDDCNFCESFDDVFESVFKTIYQDQTSKS